MHDRVGFAVQQLHHLFTDSAGAVAVIESADVGDVLGDDLDIGHADALARDPRGVLGGRHGQREQGGLRECCRREGGAQQELTPIHVPSRQLHNRANSAVQCARAVQPVVPIIGRRGAIGKPAAGDADLPMQLAGQHLGDQPGYWPAWL